MCSVGLVLVAGCLGTSNESGRISASRLGGSAESPVPRIAYDAFMTEACGDGVLADPDAVSRRPYLQQVTDRSAVVVWTALQEAPFDVEVTLPDGTEVTTVASTIDVSARPVDASQHAARLQGLEPATTYCYAIRTAEGMAVERTGFRTAPEAGTDAAVEFAVIGDMGSGGADQFHVLGQLETVPFDLMLTVGDNAYDDGTLAQYENNFFDVYGPILRSFPIFPASGNHDYRTDEAGPYREVFMLPENGGPDGMERWFSFDWGDVHFVALDTEKMGAAQAEWLDRDLLDNDRPWTIVYAHEPPYSSGEHGSSTRFRETFGPILARHRVPLVFGGHDHNYERTQPIDGTTYVVTGGGGRGTRNVSTSSWTAFSDSVLHFVWVRIEGDRLDLHAVDASGQEFDAMTIRRLD